MRWSIHKSKSSADELDSTEVGRIVPIYEAIGTFGSRAIRRAMYAAVQSAPARSSGHSSPAVRAKYAYPSRRDALIQTHFPAAGESLDTLNTFPLPRATTPDLRRIFSLSTQRRSRSSRPPAAKTPSPFACARRKSAPPSNAFSPSSRPTRKNAPSVKSPPTLKNPSP